MVDYRFVAGCYDRYVWVGKVHNKKMIIVMNIIISLMGIGAIFLARHFAFKGTGMGIKSHLFILALKLLISFFIIGSFLLYAEKHLWPIIILSAMTNIIIFHFIEAFVTQVKMLHGRGVDV